MFTGIIQTLGEVKENFSGNAGLRLIIALKKDFPSISRGSSISVNGVCLTVTRISGKNFTFDAISETVSNTNLGSLKAGNVVNIEPALRKGDELGGHFVLGHIDGVGTIKALKHGGKEVLLSVELPKVLMRFIARKGSITIEGVSLTVVKAGKNSFTVALIPYTAAHTNLGTKKVGDTVNIEVDCIARYLDTLLSRKSI